MNLTIRAWVSSIAFASAAFAVAVISMSIVAQNVYVTKAAPVTDPDRILGIQGYAANITIQSVDSTSTIIAIVRNSASGANLTYRLHISPNLIVEREDAVIEGDTIVGTKPKVRASLSDLKFGVRGTAFLKSASDQTIDVTYILIGDPPVRP